MYQTIIHMHLIIRHASWPERSCLCNVPSCLEISSESYYGNGFRIRARMSEIPLNDKRTCPLQEVTEEKTQSNYIFFDPSKF
ncbi:hypothetical protein CEXT_425901 [Caerostris extrusa]|uniref:Ycf15 n=1 Tax=Caerostris extrusa TaxID=172846 RepID=A0AAV4NHM1_CAEEX|nr:hypothetical protein CEXT_425901 [Caerostris extrusa]